MVSVIATATLTKAAVLFCVTRYPQRLLDSSHQILDTKCKMFKTIRKRDGRLVGFDQSKISDAIWKAMKVSSEGDQRDAQNVSDRVVKELSKKHPDNRILDIEEIQDEVETSLILLDYAKTAKSYILREKRREIPEHVKKLAAESKQYFRNPLAEFIYYRSYSRWIENEGRRETWIESVARYMAFMKENLGAKLSDAEYEEIRQAFYFRVFQRLFSDFRPDTLRISCGNQYGGLYHFIEI